ncbi:MAG: zinc-ribbon domain-containing protein [Thermoplasmata archaeon]|nr:zinc-ribbon domain-containing protein [Thermoplasmata archaeon]
MAAAFCMSCGKALPPGAGFCMSCGTPAPGGAAPAPLGAPPGGPLPPAPPSNMSSPGPSLTALLGLAGKRQFLVQHQILALGHSYRVMDHEKRHLFAVKGDVVQQMQSNLMGSFLQKATGSSYLGRVGERSTNMTYSLVDAQGTLIGTFSKQGGPNESIFTLTDLTGRPCVTVTLNRGGFGGITAVAVYPDGRPMMQTHGNLMRHDFRIRDPGGAELAKVHEAWASVRDTYNIDIEGNIDPLYPLAFAILIDYEKVK